MQKIDPADLIAFDIFLDKEPIAIDLVYARADHPRNIFDTALYLPAARLWGHKDIVAITLLTARQLHRKYGYTLEILDCLRTSDAQQAMQETDIVKAHPHWCQDGPMRLLAPPGHGGHPRGMAIDVRVLDANTQEVDMGTPFDYMEPSSARNYQEFSEEILNNRKILEEAFVSSAKALDLPLLPLPSEWWDFRFPADYYNQYAPLSDADLPPQMQMTNKTNNNLNDFPDGHFERLADTLIHLVNQKDGNI